MVERWFEEPRDAGSTPAVPASKEEAKGKWAIIKLGAFYWFFTNCNLPFNKKTAR